MHMGYRNSRWVQMEAAKHTTPESNRRWIAHETEQIRILADAGLTERPTGQALETRRGLIQFMTECFAKLSSS